MAEIVENLQLICQLEFNELLSFFSSRFVGLVCRGCACPCGLMWNLSMIRLNGTKDVRCEIGEKNGVALLLQVNLPS